MGVIERSSPSNPWNMPILAAPKKDANGVKTYDKPRVCIDPQALNNELNDDTFLLSKVTDIFDQLTKFHVVSKIDLAQGFTQFLVHPNDQFKLCFTWQGV